MYISFKVNIWHIVHVGGRASFEMFSGVAACRPLPRSPDFSLERGQEGQSASSLHVRMCKTLEDQKIIIIYSITKPVDSYGQKK